MCYNKTCQIVTTFYLHYTIETLIGHIPMGFI